MKLFAWWIARRIIWCHGRLFYTINSAHLLTDLIIKTFTLVTIYSGWDTISGKPLIHQGFSYCFNLLVGCNTKVGLATLNLENVLVITKTFSFPSLLGSTFMKFILNRSMGLLATIDPFDGFGSIWGSLAVWHHLHFIYPICHVLKQSTPIKSFSY